MSKIRIERERERERLSPRNHITLGDIELDMVDLFYFYDSLSAFCLNSNPHERCIWLSCLLCLYISVS